MYARVQYAEYLAEIREQVCSHCPERMSGRPPLTWSCRHCGVELQLPQLVEAAHDADVGLTDLEPAPNRGAICAGCVHLGDGSCPCRVRSLAALLGRAVLAVDERRRQHDLLHRYVARQLRKEKVPVAEMMRAYEASTGACVACD